MEKAPIIIIAVVILAAVLFWAFQSGFLAKIFSGPAKPIPIPQGIIFFYGQGCPHCKNVEDFISQNKIEEKVQFTKLEVWYNKDNQNILVQIAQKCKIKSDEVGIPLLWDGAKCYVGDTDVINFLKNAANIK